MLINEPECEPDPNFVDVDISYNNEIKSKDVDDIMISTTSRRLTITTAHCGKIDSRLICIILHMYQQAVMTGHSISTLTANATATFKMVTLNLTAF